MFTKLRLINFKAWWDTGELALKPVTPLVGAEPSRKSTLVESLRLTI